MYNIAYKLYDMQCIIYDAHLLSIRKLAPLPTCCKLQIKKKLMTGEKKTDFTNLKEKI